jgi:hypothetical protein
MPLAVFPAAGALVAWLMARSTAKDYKRLFGGLREFASAKRFLARTVAGILLIVAGAVFLVHTRSVYIATHPLKLHEIAGVTFGSPRDWRKLSDREVERIRRRYPGDILGAYEPEDDALFLVSLEKSRWEPSRLLQERRRQIDEELSSWDVMRAHRLELVEIRGHPAVYLDVERRDAGRGRKVDLRLRRGWVGVALVLPGGDGEVRGDSRCDPGHDGLKRNCD